VQTCYAKWLSICSGYCEFNALVYVYRVELSLFFFFFSFVVFLLVPVLYACATMVNKDEYNMLCQGQCHWVHYVKMY